MGRLRTTQRRRTRSQKDRQLRALLSEVESLYDAGLYAEAIRVGEPIWGLPSSSYVRGRVRLYAAQAYLQLGKPDLGKSLLDDARRDFEAIGDAQMIVECMAAEASLACIEQRPEALSLATEALRACRSLRQSPIALEVQILSSLASCQLLVGQTSGAIKTFEEAIDRADPVVDMRRLGKLLGNAGIAYDNAGQLEKAIKCSSRAVALFEALRDVVSLAREENNLGCYLIHRGELTLARTHLEHALQLFEQTNLQKDRGLLLLSLCELFLAQGDPGQAIAYADSAIKAGESQSEAWSVANARMWKARIAARVGNDFDCDAEYEIAANLLEKAGMSERLVSCYTAYADALEKRGDLARAYGQLKLAFGISARLRENGSMVD